MDCLLVDPVDGGRLPADELLGLEPERDLLLRRVDGVRAVADVTSNLNEKNFYHRSNVFCTSVAVARSYQFKGFYPNQISVYI